MIEMKIFTGKVISKKMEKTATVAVERVVVHPVYKKRTKKIKKYQVHDEFEVSVGQIVKFTACKPFSRTKKWKIIDVVGTDKGTGIIVPNKKKGNTEDTVNTESTENKKEAVKRRKRKGGKK